MMPRTVELSARLAQLGREAARAVWAEHAYQRKRISRSPSPRAWDVLGAGVRQVEPDRVLGGDELLVFVRAYREELRAQAVRGLQPGECLEIGGSGDGLVRAVITRNGEVVAAALADKAELAMAIAMAGARAIVEGEGDSRDLP